MEDLKITETETTENTGKKNSNIVEINGQQEYLIPHRFIQRIIDKVRNIAKFNRELQEILNGTRENGNQPAKINVQFDLFQNEDETFSYKLRAISFINGDNRLYVNKRQILLFTHKGSKEIISYDNFRAFLSL